MPLPFPISMPLPEPIAFPTMPQPMPFVYSPKPHPSPNSCSSQLTEIDRINGAQVGVGRWTEYEHKKFLEGHALRPLISWKHVADMVGSRSARQVRTHEQKYNLKLKRRQKRKDKMAQEKKEATKVVVKKSCSFITISQSDNLVQTNSCPLINIPPSDKLVQTNSCPMNNIPYVSEEDLLCMDFRTSLDFSSHIFGEQRLSLEMRPSFDFSTLNF